jgi:toxin ParE1/3/4
MRLRHTVEARTHIRAIYDYIAERNPAAAVAVLSRIRAAAELLKDFPGSDTPELILEHSNGS